MKIKFIDFKLKQDFDRIVILHYCHFIILSMLLLIEFLSGFTGFLSSLIKIGFLFFIYKMYFKMMRNFYYTFWTFSFFIFLYMLVGLWNGFFVYSHIPIAWLYFLAIIALAVECYYLSSPLYYPRVSWWEYDFRFRDDLKVEIIVDNQKMSGRLTDIRRNAGCVVLFESLKTGAVIDLKTIEGEIELVAEIVSKRFNNVGRGIIYGVKFHFKQRDDRNNFLSLCRFFENRKRINKKSKYHKLDEKQENL
jgi:hypothetical protein